MRAMNLLSALNDVRDTYVLESALPPLGEASRKAVPAFRRKGKDGSLGRVFSDGWLVAAVCTLVAIGTLSGMVWLGQRPPTPPVSSDSATFPSSSEEHPVTEGIHTASLVYVSHGDGTCSVKASDGFGQLSEDIHLVIPEASPTGDVVTAVEDYGFIWKTGLKSVTLPDTVTAIGQWAFAECTSLETVELSDSLRSIGTAAFLECTALKEITLPEGLTALGDSAFSTCTALAEATLPSTLKAIPQWSFYNCASLSELTLSEGLTEIGYSAFCGCVSLISVELPDSVSSLSKGAFAGCTELLSVTSGSGLQAVGALAFDGCTRLATITLPDGLQTLNGTALRDCNALRTVAFTGTREAWRALLGEQSPLPKGSTVHCTDGVIKY